MPQHRSGIHQLQQCCPFVALWLVHTWHRWAMHWYSGVKGKGAGNELQKGLQLLVLTSSKGILSLKWENLVQHLKEATSLLPFHTSLLSGRSRMTPLPPGLQQEFCHSLAHPSFPCSCLPNEASGAEEAHTFQVITHVRQYYNNVYPIFHFTSKLVQSSAQINIACYLIIHQQDEPILVWAVDISTAMYSCKVQ